MNSARIQKQIQALGRGEMDLSTLIGQIREILVESDTSADGLLRELEEAHRDDTITTSDYSRLTQVIIENAPPVSPEETDLVGDTVLVETDLELEPEEGLTSLAPSSETPTASLGTSSEEIDIGARLRDRFILDEVLGVGGMGTVYKGRDALKLEAQDRNPFIAVKILNDRFKQHPEAFIAFQREASRQQRLAHPNIATVYEFHRDGGLMYITMEFLDGRTLDTVIRDDVRPVGGLEFNKALPIIEDLCAALSHAHTKNIIHADFKPGNCFLTQNDQVKVLDFGIARAMKDPNAAAGDETLFDPRSIGALTPAYASPEMLEGVEDADPRDDIYGLACVVYELLTGRHPFGRVPGDQAKHNELAPKKIKKLSRRQNEALRKALAFDRSERTVTVQAFVDGLKPDASRSSLLWPLVLVAPVLVMAVGLFLIPTYFDDREIEETVALLTSEDSSQVQQGILALQDLDPDLRSQVLTASVTALIANIESDYQRNMRLEDSQVPFPAVQDLLSRGLALFPDSNRLVSLQENFDQRLQTYLAALAALFEEYLTPRRLLPDQTTDDLHDLLERLRLVDPESSLLVDDRIQAAYATAVEETLLSQDYSEARRYLEAGLALVPADPTLSDLRDRLEVIEQDLALARTIEELESELDQRVAAIENLEDLPALVPVVESLRRIDPTHPKVLSAGELLAERFAEPLSAITSSSSLPMLIGFAASYTTAWTVLEQPSILQAVESRRLALIEAQDVLVASIQSLIGRPDMRADDGTTVLQLIQQLRSIDPEDVRPDALIEAIVDERLQRARSMADAERWDDARTELAAASALELPESLIVVIAGASGQIDSEEQQALARVEEQLRLSEAQQEQERLALEASQREAEAERQRQAAIARQAGIDAAASALAGSLSDFDLSAPEASVRLVQSRIAALERLDGAHAELGRAQAELSRLSATSVRLMDSPERALATLAVLTQLVGGNPELAKLRTDLERERTAELEEQRGAQIATMRSEIATALSDLAVLERAEVRRQIDRSMSELTNLAGSESEIVQDARLSYVEAFVSAAGPLIEAKRFSLAGELIDSAKRQVPTAPSVLEARVSLDAAEKAYRAEREVQQRTARLLALRQRFELEVGSGQLERAEQTLAEFRSAGAGGSFARTLAPGQLAQAYANRAAGALEDQQFEEARLAIERSASYAEDTVRIDRLRADLEAAELEGELVGWFSGESNAAASSLLASVERYRALKEGFDQQRDGWAQLVNARLISLESDPERYNELLADAVLLLPNSGLLSSLAPLDATKLELADLLGSWCDPGVKVTFGDADMRFVGNNLDETYAVDSYEVLEEEIVVRWQQSRSRTIEFEFGRFSAGEMVQLRGRESGGDSWQDYNRAFSRCQ